MGLGSIGQPASGLALCFLPLQDVSKQSPTSMATTEISPNHVLYWLLYYFSIAVIKHHDRGNLQKKEFIWASILER